MHALVLVYAIAFTALVGVPLVIAPLAWIEDLETIGYAALCALMIYVRYA